MKQSWFCNFIYRFSRGSQKSQECTISAQLKDGYVLSNTEMPLSSMPVLATSNEHKNRKKHLSSYHTWMRSDDYGSVVKSRYWLLEATQCLNQLYVHTHEKIFSSSVQWKHGICLGLSNHQ